MRFSITFRCCRVGSSAVGGINKAGGGELAAEGFATVD